MAEAERPGLPAPEPEAGWAAGWEEHSRSRIAAGLAATPAQRLAWLEEMIELAHATGALPRPREEEEGGVRP